LVVGGSVVSTGNTGVKIVEAGVSNNTNSEEGIVSDIVTETYGEKYRTDSTNVTSSDTKYFLVGGL